MRSGPKQSGAFSQKPRAGDGNVDAEALRRLAAGEIGAAAAVYDRHQAAVFDFVARLVGRDADAEDLVQMTFLVAARRAATFDGRESCRPWLLGIAARLVRRRRRSLARFARMVGDLTSRLRSSSLRDPHELLVARDELTRVERAFAGLSDAKRTVLLMAEVEGMTCEEIASALGIPIGTVWTRLHHARRELSLALTSGGAL